MRGTAGSRVFLFSMTKRRIIIWLAVGLVFAELSGCAGEQWRNRERDSYTVRAGDTVYGIAWRYGLDYRELARWNRLGGGYSIFPGQVLVLRRPPGSAVAGTAKTRPPARGRAKAPLPGKPPPPAPTPEWLWPVKGRILSSFGAAGAIGKGLDIAGTDRAIVRAAATGHVVYSGSGLIGYGQLIIIKHNNTFLSAYGYNSELLVSQGDQVSKGQQIARMGKGPGKRPMLHFEIRINGKPVDPIRYLPTR
ncbi:MAG: peptidoglycan DD-metalloendopeptidase family protein [Gammaproteobacteria bacterium]|nr:peptidoglycan DD-metalloendopeptidase family protein [Gammaproteobacteria bacterium]